jgi:uncharacterized protein DUF5666
MKFKKLLAGLALVFSFAAVLASCHSGSNSANAPGTPIVSWGVLKESSVIINEVSFDIVNGITFDASSAQITNHDNPDSATSETLLHDGMMVKIRGRLNPDGVSGIAEKVKNDSEIEGTITAAEGDSITILGQQIFTDGRTVYGNGTDLMAHTVNQRAVVHGIRDSQGRFLATRIGFPTASSSPIPIPPADHLKGVVESPFTPGDPPTLTFKLRGLTVVTDSRTVILPDGATINPGDLVRISGPLSGQLSARASSGTTVTPDLIVREDLENEEFEPQENEQFMIEGFVTNFTAQNADFTVGDVTTRLAGTASFQGGIAADLINNVRTEAEGRMTGGVLVADKIKFADVVRIEANAVAAGGADVLGEKVVVSSLTEFANLTGGAADISAGQGLKIRGFENPDGTLTATRIEGLVSPMDANKISIQGVVEASSDSTRTITVIGTTINASGATQVVLDGKLTFPELFFLTLARNRSSVIKATGTFSAGPQSLLTADKVEMISVQ